MEREANAAAAADSSKTGVQGGSRAGHTSTGLDSVLGSHCCISGAGDALGEPPLQYFLRVRDREPLFLSLALLHAPVFTVSNLPHHLWLPQISCLWCHPFPQIPQPICLHSTLYPHRLHWGSFPLPRGNVGIVFFNLRCRCSLIVPCVLH